MTTDQLETVALSTVIVDLNVRTDTKLDKSFVSSIRNHGILQPPIGYRGDDDQVHITCGQRRTLAAIEIGSTTIDVILKPKEIAEAARIVTQLTENDQRQELSDSERVHGYKQLAMFGISADQISRKTNKPRAHVDTALKVAGSEIAEDAIASYPINLEQAAALVEFEDNAADVERLLEIAGERPGNFNHEAQRIRDARGFAAAKAAREVTLAAEGFEVLAERPDYNDRTVKSIESLWRADDETTTTLTPEDLVDIEGAVVYVGQPGYGSDEPTRTTYYVRGWAEQGLATYESSSSTKGPLTDKEKAERKAQRELNADMKSATIVRRAWLKDDFLGNPKAWHLDRDLNASVLRAVTLNLLGEGLGGKPDKKAYTLAAELLGLEVEQPDQWSADCPARRKLAELVLENTGFDPLTIAFAVAIASSEWMVGDPTIKWIPNDARTAVYLKQLQDWGYGLADVEQRIIDASEAQK